MVAPVVKHATLATGTDAGTGEIHKAEWNAQHTFTVSQASLLGASAAGNIAEITLGTGLSFVAGALTLDSFQPLDSDLTSWAGVTRASGFDTFAATPTSANLAALLTDESGSSKVIFSAGTLDIASGKTLTVSNTLTFTGTDASSVAFGAGGTVLYDTAISDTAYDATSWNGVTTIAPSKNAVRDQFETIIALLASDTAYASTWDGVTTIPPSKNAVYDKFETFLNIPWVAANWVIWSSSTGSTANGTALTTNTIYYQAYVLTRRTTISDLGARVQTTSAGGNFKRAIYASGSNGYPSGTPVAETGNISTTAGGVITADITGADVTLNPGLYWLAIWQDNSTATYTTQGAGILGPEVLLVGNATAGNISNTAVVWCALSSAETFGTWPNATSETFTLLTTRAQNALLHVKIVS